VHYRTFFSCKTFDDTQTVAGITYEQLSLQTMLAQNISILIVLRIKEYVLNLPFTLHWNFSSLKIKDSKKLHKVLIKQDLPQKYFVNEAMPR